MNATGLSSATQRRQLPRRHYWRVVFRNDVMGFQKVKVVPAVGYSQAVTFAGDRLEREGYARCDLAVIAVERGEPAPEKVTTD